MCKHYDMQFIASTIKYWKNDDIASKLKIRSNIRSVVAIVKITIRDLPSIRSLQFENITEEVRIVIKIKKYNYK